MTCQTTYFDWVIDTLPEATAQRTINRANCNMRCTLQDGHPGPHKWEPDQTLERPAWTTPLEYNQKSPMNPRKSER